MRLLYFPLGRRRDRMSVEEHKAKGKRSIHCFVVTVSDTRDEATDTSLQLIKSMLADENHRLAGYRIVKDAPAQIESLLAEAMAGSEVDGGIVNGRPGISPRRGTFYVLVRLHVKRHAGIAAIF